MAALRVARAAAAVAATLLAAACQMTDSALREAARVPPPAAPRVEVHRTVDPKTGRLVQEWSMLVSGTNKPLRHGKWTRWHAPGVKSWERDYREGRPWGWWRAWHENGQMASECFFGDPEAETTMTFWYANGSVWMQGPAKSGVRSGTWRVYHENGVLAEEGDYAGSLKDGTWKAWTEDGQPLPDRVWRRNVRVGAASLDARQ